MKNRTVNVTEFKAKCLALLEEVGTEGGTITVTKRGRPLATVSAPQTTAWKSPEGMWKGIVSIERDPLDVDLTELWESARPDGKSR